MQDARNVISKIYTPGFNFTDFFNYFALKDRFSKERPLSFMPPKKSFFKRLFNFRTAYRYLSESASIIKQGRSFKDKFFLSLYFLRTPFIFIRSLVTRKTFREIEEKRKYLWSSITLKNNKGIFYCGNNILTIHTIDENHEKKIYPYLEMTSGIFIDVGAHAGKYSIWLANDPNNKVIAIEPEEINFSMLKKNISLNHLTNIITINKGAYSKAASLPFYVSGKGDGTHSVNKVNAAIKKIFIEVDTLDNIVERSGLNSPVSKIKIDVEGAELEVLKGAATILQRDHPALIIEIWDENKENIKAVTNFLEYYDYKAEQIDDDNYFFS